MAPSTEEFESKVAELINMGFARDNCVKALQAAYNNTDRAVEYLINGIPEKPTASIPTGEQGAQVLSGLMSNPQFAQIRQVIRSNPSALPHILQQIGQSSPQLYNLIAQNPDTFERLIMEDADFPEEGGHHQQQAPPGSIVVTAEEQQAIQRLSDLGFSKLEAAQAYMACDKNEELAANLLFDRLANGDIEMEVPGQSDHSQGGEGGEGEGDEDDDNLFN